MGCFLLFAVDKRLSAVGVDCRQCINANLSPAYQLTRSSLSRLTLPYLPQRRKEGGEK